MTSPTPTYGGPHVRGIEAVVTRTSGALADDLLAEAVRVVDAHCPVVDSRADSLGRGVVSVRVWATFGNAAEAEAKRTEVAAALSQYGPTDTLDLGPTLNTEDPMDTYDRPGKHTIRVGDRVRVAGNDVERGWSNATLVRLRPGLNRDGTPTAVVTSPPRRDGLGVGVRHVSAARLTKRHAL